MCFLILKFTVIMFFQLFHPNAPTLFMLSKLMMSNKALLAQRVYSHRALYQHPIYKTVFSDDRTMNQTIFQRMARMIPKTQYDLPNTVAWTLKGLRERWESIPVVFSMFLGFFLAALSSIWACFHKMDLVFKGDYQNSLSRTMDLRNPKVHKLIQVRKYEPWPEMQVVLDAMKAAEELQNLQACDCDECAQSDDDDEECDE